ncbi:Rod shape-determining protein RodA [hydrothermal vent metagenome]|uniref:Rod shape-determining protein RodA n=1 Tax=hydrothermal vent metagenome TaxID=652676 RepID=A0A3B1E259_9ZZZZ
MILFDKRIISHFNFELIILILPLIFLSYNLILETNQALAQKQLFYFALSFIVFVLVFMFPFRRFIKLIPIFYWIGIVLLVCVKFFGVTKLGATRWLEIPLINITIQPSEIFKPVFLLMLGLLIHNRQPSINGYNIKDFSYFSFYIILPFILIAKEPDLGTAIILLLTGYGVLFIMGVNKKIIIGIVLAIMVSSPFIYTYLIKDYQKKRISDFISEKPSYHVQQSIIAIGSGGLTGKNKEDATQTQLKFLPIATSDFIFASFVERYGFLGAAGLIIIYLLIIIHLLILNVSFEKDYMIRVFASGFGLLIFLNMSVNILMVIGFAPVVGLPLPMFSYGGSSFLNFIVIIAILENLLAYRFLNSYKFVKRM